MCLMNYLHLWVGVVHVDEHPFEKVPRVRLAVVSPQALHQRLQRPAALNHAQKSQQTHPNGSNGTEENTEMLVLGKKCLRQFLFWGCTAEAGH